jgi:hypothetical protein
MPSWPPGVAQSGPSVSVYAQAVAGSTQYPAAHVVPVGQPPRLEQSSAQRGAGKHWPVYRNGRHRPEVQTLPHAPQFCGSFVSVGQLAGPTLQHGSAKVYGPSQTDSPTEEQLSATHMAPRQLHVVPAGQLNVRWTPSATQRPRAGGPPSPGK